MWRVCGNTRWGRDSECLASRCLFVLFLSEIFPVEAMTKNTFPGKVKDVPRYPRKMMWRKFCTEIRSYTKSRGHVQLAYAKSTSPR